MRSPWLASPVLRTMLASHALALAVLLVHPGTWPACLAALATLHAIVIGLVLQPRNRVFGPNLTRLSDDARRRGEVAITFDDGPHVTATPQVLDLLERHGVHASFFVVGQQARQHPELVREIARRGHRVENHSWSHAVLFSLFESRRLAREIDATHALIEELCGRRPCYFRPPAGFRSPLLDPLLRARGLHLATWTRRGFDARDGDPARVLRRLVRGLAAGDILLLHDGDSARAADGTPVVLQVLPKLLALLGEQGLRATHLPDPVQAPVQAPGKTPAQAPAGSAP